MARSRNGVWAAVLVPLAPCERQDFPCDEERWDIGCEGCMGRGQRLDVQAAARAVQRRRASMYVPVTQTPVACEVCGKEFKSSATLKAHKRGVCGPRTTCDECGRSFTDAGYSTHLAYCQHRDRDIWRKASRAAKDPERANAGVPTLTSEWHGPPTPVRDFDFPPCPACGKGVAAGVNEDCPYCGEALPASLAPSPGS